MYGSIPMNFTADVVDTREQQGGFPTPSAVAIYVNGQHFTTTKVPDNIPPTKYYHGDDSRYGDEETERIVTATFTAWLAKNMGGK